MKGNKKKQSALQELMSYAGRYRYLTYAALLLSAFSSICAIMPFVYIWGMMKEAIYMEESGNLPEHLIGYGQKAVLWAALGMAVYIVGLMCAHFSAFHAASNVRKTCMHHVAGLPQGTIEKIGSGSLRRTINDSVGATETLLAHMLPDMAGAIVTPAVMLVLLFVFDWRFGLVSLIPLIFAFLSMGKMAGPDMAADMKAYQDALDAMNNEAVEYVRGIPVVKAFQQTVFSFQRFKATIDNYYKFCMNYTIRCRKPMVLFSTFLNSSFLFFILMGMLLFFQGENLGQLLLNFLFYVILSPVIGTVMNKVMFLSENVMMTRDAVMRIHGILDLKPLEQPEVPKKPENTDVLFHNVSFHYENSEKEALKQISFHVKNGQTAAFVGPSGSGKTTIAGLLSRFWDVTEGSISIGGVNVKEIGNEFLSQQIAYVFQDSKLLKMSIFENVRLGNPNAEKEQVLAALHTAQCDDIIAKMPQGIDTVIGAKGVYLSGGECQRIAIARMVLKDAPILVLDEATAFADPENEALVQKAFEEMAKNKTVILIAHRLTTVQNADCIYVLENGEIAEQGTPAELLEKGGLYHAMWNNYQKAVSWKVGGTN